ncbi:MAG: amidohydrolase family protein, partial [Lachnospiraceae bacterium]|nr:amidohydrolase family protein [Candidatus Equihabitans merdae]
MSNYLIKNGLVVDGSGSKPYAGDLIVRDGKISGILPRKEADAKEPVPDMASVDTSSYEMSQEEAEHMLTPDLQVLDAEGAYVTPGFVDIHRHGDWEALKDKEDELLSRQGLTTVVNGNCGLATAPAGDIFRGEVDEFLRSVVGVKPAGVDDCNRSMADYFSVLERRQRSVNTGMLCGSGMIRAAVRGFGGGELSENEKRGVWRHLEESLGNGALGVSLGIGYAPEMYYDAAGLIEALQPMKGSQVPVITHIRTEGDGMLDALDEVMGIAKALQVPLHVSHLKCIGKRNFGTRPRIVKDMFAQARAEGLQVDYDLYPYTMGSTQLVHVLPPEVQEGGAEACIARLRDKDQWPAITARLSKPADDFENIVEMAGFENIYAVTLYSKKYRDFAGLSIADIAKHLKQDTYETLYDLLAEEELHTTMLDLVADEDDMLYFLNDSHASLISDAIYPEGGGYHPRVYGAYPHFLEEYVTKNKNFSIQDAVQKMTSRPAAVLHIDRGLIKEGAA